MMGLHLFTNTAQLLTMSYHIIMKIIFIFPLSEIWKQNRSVEWPSLHLGFSEADLDKVTERDIQAGKLWEGGPEDHLPE